MKIAFENEIIIVNSENEVQNFINGNIASEKIINDIKKKLKKIIKKDCISGKIDACQLEIRNSGGKNSFNEAQDEILKLFEILSSFLRDNYGLKISKKVVPNQKYTPTSSGLYESFDMIMAGLISLGEEYSKSSNVAGLHLNFDTSLKKYIKINNNLYNLLKNNDLDALGISIERLKKYQKAIKGVNLLFGYELGDSFEYFESDKDAYEKLFDEDGDPYFDYNLLRLKKGSNSLIGELRSFDAGVTLKDLEDKTKRAYELILSQK